MTPLICMILMTVLPAPSTSLPSSDYQTDYDYLHDAEGEEYQYDDSDQSEEKYSPPSLASVIIQSQKVHEVVKEEDVIRLPCRVHNPGKTTELDT